MRVADRLRAVPGVLALAATLLGAGSAHAEGSAEAGKQVFEKVCTACHTIGGGVKVGPDLSGVTERRDRAWIVRFVRDPAAMRASNDPVALENRAKFPLAMPNLGLPEGDVENVVAFLGGGQSAPAGTPRMLVPSLAAGALLMLGLTLIPLRAGRKDVLP